MIDRSKIRSLRIPVALAATLVCLACNGGAPPEGVIAHSVHGDTTMADLDGYILSMPAQLRQPAKDQKVDEWRKTILEEMLASRRLAEEADEKGLLATDEGRSFLEGQWNPILVDRVRALRTAQVVVDEQKLRDYYDAHPEEFGHGPQIRVRHIFKRTTRDATPEEREAKRREIDELHRRLLEGASFIELARTESDSETAPLDGLIGRLDPGALGPTIDKIVWGLEEGEISDVVSTPVGFHIFRVDNKLEPFHMEFAEARTRLQRRFQRDETEASLDRYFHELLEASGATYDPSGLSGGDETVLFTLGDVRITRGEFMERLFALPFARQREISLTDHLQEAVANELYLWEAERQHLADEPDLVAQRQQLERTARVELAYRARRKAYVEAIDDSVLQAYYEENKARFRSPQLLRVTLLLRRFEGEGKQWFALYEDLDRIAKGVRAGTLDFAAEAAAGSEDITAARGGDSGWIRPGAIGEWAGPRASKTVLALGLDEISDPILVEKYDEDRMLYERRGYMLVRPEEIRGSQERPFEEIRDTVAEHFVVNGSEDLERQIRDEVLQEIEATIFQDRL
jgi:peptidyl-prolyl cis-trans isomerase C